MELKDITCDLKYAKTLKKLGVDQTTSYAIYDHSQFTKASFLIPFKVKDTNVFGFHFDRRNKETQKQITSTFTTEELLKILPKEIKHNHNGWSSYCLCIKYLTDSPIAYYKDNKLSRDLEILVSESNKKLSNALAMVLIWLLKNKKIKILGTPIKKEKKIKKTLPQKPPTERVIYKRVPKRAYSFLHKCWFTFSKPYTTVKSKLVWRDLINEETEETIDDFGENTAAKLSERVLSYINNPKLF